MPLVPGFTNDADVPFTKPVIHGQNAAYMLFTSGSTGRAKLTVNHHAGILNRILQTESYVDAGKDAIVLRKTPFEFDVSMWELFWPLLQGLRLEIAPEKAHADPRQIADMVAQRRISHLHFVPSVLSVFLETIHAGELASVRDIFTSGEALPRALCGQLRRLHDCQLHNLYGPTEAAVEVSHARVDLSETQPPHLGRPLKGNTTTILDTNLMPVRPGQIGGLYLGGSQLARGYASDPRRTAQVFLPNPFATRPGSRLYVSGDLARFDAEGLIHFHGRRDHQIKLRGIRVELGEITAALQSQSFVREAFVTARGSGIAKTLVAFVVLQSQAPHTYLEDLRENIASELPKHLCPNHIQVLERMPKSASGKVNPAALPQFVDAPAKQETPEQGPQARLWDLWTAILGRAPRSLDDDFFSLGGNSLLVVRLANGIAKQTGREIPLVQLFQATTIRQQTALLGNRLAKPQPAVMFHRSQLDGTWLFIHSGDGFVHHYRSLADALADTGSCVGLPAFWEPQPGSSIQTIARDLVGRIPLSQCKPPFRLIGWSAGGLLAFEMARQLQDADVPVDHLALIDCRRLDKRTTPLEKEPLFDFLKQITDCDIALMKQALADGLETIGQAPDFHGVWRKLAAIGIELPPPEQLALLYARRQVLLQACSRYRPKTIEIPVTHVHALGKRHLNGWPVLCRGGFREFQSRACHETILKDPHVAPLAYWIRNTVFQPDPQTDTES